MDDLNLVKLARLSRGGSHFPPSMDRYDSAVSTPTSRGLGRRRSDRSAISDAAPSQSVAEEHQSPLANPEFTLKVVDTDAKDYTKYSKKMSTKERKEMY